jgi:hypothetical protein
VIIAKFDIVSIAVLEPEADAPLAVDAYRPLTFHRIAKELEPISRRKIQIPEEDISFTDA